MTRKTLGRLGPQGRTALGRRIRALRADESLEDLAARAGISSGTLGQLERGESDPQLGTLLRIQAALGLASIEEVIGPMPKLPSVEMPVN